MNGAQQGTANTAVGSSSSMKELDSMLIPSK